MFELSPRDFEGNTQKLISKYNNKITLIKFYLPRCHYCVISQPDYELLDKNLSDDFNIAQLNCDVYRDLVDTARKSSIYGYDINGFPTYIVLYKGHFIKYYEGDRSYNDMVNFLYHIKTILQ